MPLQRVGLKGINKNHKIKFHNISVFVCGASAIHKLWAITAARKCFKEYF